MKLVILLICLGCERYLHVGTLLLKIHWRRFHWIENYTHLIQKLLGSKPLFRGWLGLMTLLLPSLIVVALIYAILAHWVYGLVGILLGILILLYCLGPDDLYHQLQKYFDAKEKNATAEAAADYLALTGETPTDDEQLAARKLTKAIFIQANERFFGVIFWFIILGPVGALLYRLAVIFRYKAETQIEPYNIFSEQIIILQNILDWIPARITILLYLLVGNFHGTFGDWRARFATGLTNSRELLGNSGVAALSAGITETASIAENKQALELVDRALIIVLVIIALFTLGELI